MIIENLSGVKVNQSISYTKNLSASTITSLEDSKLNEHSINDKFFISHEAKALLEEDKKETPPEDPFLKCIKIAMRIINGDRVPSKDAAFFIGTSTTDVFKCSLTETKK